MLVPRGQMMSGGGGVGEVVDGFFIRRSASPISVGDSRLLHSLSDNKENIPPLGFNYRRKRSPLPEWYPRTPLRDITALVNALDRRRLRVTSQQRNHGTESPPPSGVLPQESIVTDQTQDADNSSGDPHPPLAPPPPSGVLPQESIVTDQTQNADNSSGDPHPPLAPPPPSGVLPRESIVTDQTQDTDNSSGDPHPPLAPPPPSGVLPRESIVTDQTQDTDNSSGDPDRPSAPPPSGVLPQQSIVSNQTQGYENPSHVPEPSSRPLAETMQVVSTECCTILSPNSITNASKQMEPRKLSVSIDEVAKVVMENLRSISNVPAKKPSTRTRSLLSMR